MRPILVLVCLFLGTVGSAQQGRMPLHRDLYQAYEEHLNKKGTDFHTSFKPYLRSDLLKETALDTALPPKIAPWMRYLDHPKRELGKWETNLRAGPILDLGFGVDLNDPDDEAVNYTLGGGFYVEADIGPMLTANLSARAFTATAPFYIDSFIQDWQVMPGMGYSGGVADPYNYNDINGYVSFTPKKWFNFQIGRGKHFVGDGYRTLFLSDNANSYPYFKIETQFWHVKYTIMYTQLKHVLDNPGNSNAHFKKYSTFHHLSWNVSKRVNFSFFESIVWQAKDTLQNRGYEIGYMNPVIFFRPVEFEEGSADNALMGFSFRVKVAKDYQFYGQLLLDEFLMQEVRAGEGWFGNKQAFQLGFKAFSPFGLKGFAFQTEFNYVRPFVYTHGSPKQNYAHWNQPLAHPLGSNFLETVNIIDYRKGRWHFQEQFNYAFSGSDTSGNSYGNNIFLPESERPNDIEGRNINHGYYVGGESPETLFYNKLRVGYILDPSSGFRVEVGHLYRQRSGEGFKQSTNMFFIGIRTTLFQRYEDF